MDDADARSLELLARAAHGRADYSAAVGLYEESFAAYRRAGDLTAAARAARTVGWFHGWVFGEWSVHRGWIRRARRLLEQAVGDRARGWVVLDDALSGSDLDEQRRQYLEAIELARRTNDGDLECDAMTSLGMMLVFSGQVTEGMAHLDEALASICGGDVAELPVLEGCLCGLITARERTGDVSRAQAWLRAAQAVMQRGNLLAVAGHCRAHYAGILIAAGEWADAEDELIAALDLIPQGIASWEDARCRLADLRVRQGRLEEAEQLLAGLHHRVDAAAPNAALHLARSRPDLALELLDRALATRPEQHAVPLLALLVQAQLANGDLDQAHASSAELSRLAQAQPSDYATAVAAAAHARVCAATGDGDPRQCWHGALTSFERALMPADAAIARLELGRYLAADKPTVAIAELDAAHATFERIGARRHADEAAALLRSLGGPSKTGPKLGGELTRREREVFELLALGLTNAEIGRRLFITAKTAEHHVGRILFKLGLRSRAEAAASAARR